MSFFHFWFFILLKHPLKQDFMQDLAKGMYVATYQIYEGIWIAKNNITKSLLWSTRAENKVPSKPPINSALVILRYLSTIFLHCF